MVGREKVEIPSDSYTHSFCAEKLEWTHRSGRMMSIVCEKEVVALRSIQITMNCLSWWHVLQNGGQEKRCRSAPAAGHARPKRLSGGGARRLDWEIAAPPQPDQSAGLERERSPR